MGLRRLLLPVSGGLAMLCLLNLLGIFADGSIVLERFLGPECRMFDFQSQVCTTGSGTIGSGSLVLLIDAGVFAILHLALRDRVLEPEHVRSSLRFVGICLMLVGVLLATGAMPQVVSLLVIPLGISDLGKGLLTVIAGGALTVVSIHPGLLSQDAGNIDPTAVEDLLFDVEAPQFGPPKMTASSIDRFRTVGEMRRAHGLHGHEGVLEVHARAPR